MADDIKPRKFKRSAEDLLAAEISAAKALILSLGADADDQEMIEIVLDGETNLGELVDQIFQAMQLDQEVIDGIAERAANLAQRKKRLEERVSFRRAKIEQALAIYGEKIERPEATFTLTQRAPGLVVTDEAAIPSTYWKTIPSLDKAGLKKALQGGADIPGAVLDNAPATLTIRTR